jgi:cobalt/nickel transport protein
MSKKGRLWIGIILMFLVVLIAVLPLYRNKTSDFSGADDKAEGMIKEIDPSYQPWANAIIELPGGETESLLFCLQASIGAGIFGYGIGVLKERNKYKKWLDKDSNIENEKDNVKKKRKERM